jgi:hypothetical protein
MFGNAPPRIIFNEDVFKPTKQDIKVIEDMLNALCEEDLA